MHNSIKDQIIEAFDLRKMAEEQGAEFGNGSRSHCPIHKGTGKTTFQLSDNDKKWKCWGSCGKGGNVIDFYMAIYGQDFKTAMHELASKANIEIKPQDPVFKTVEKPKDDYLRKLENLVRWGQEHLDPYSLGYLHQRRGLVDSTIQQFRLGYNPQDLWRDGWRDDGKKSYISKGIVIPHLNSDGNPFWANIRRPLPRTDLAEYVGVAKGYENVKYWGVPGKYRRMTGRHSHQMRDILVLVEGEFDMMTLWQEGNDLVDVGTFGGANNLNLCRADAMYILRYKRVLGCFDPDNAGKNGLSKLIRKLGRLEVVAPPGNCDLNDFHVAGGNLRKWVEAAVNPNLK